MAQFSYKGRDAGGALVQGTLEGANSEAVAGDLIRRGITPIQISEQAATTSGGEDVFAALRKLPLFQPKVTLDDLILFCRQMYALTKAGIPIIRAMKGLADSTRSIALKEALLDVVRRLESGINLAGCMQAHPRIFDDLMVSMIHVGENTGKLEEAFKQLASNLELERDTRKRVKQALRYPTMVISALGVALAVVNLFVIPAFAGVFKKLGADLPLPTQLLVASSDFFVNYWWLVLALLIGAFYGFSNWTKTENGRYLWDRFKLRMPILGVLFEKIALSRFSRNFAMMLGAGMPIIHALALVAEAVDNSYVGRSILSMKSGIERGDSMLRTATATGLFSPLVLQMLAVGEETGQVDSLLLEVADFYDEEVDYGVKRLADAIEPILIVAMGVLVLILALGVFLPIWDMGQAAIKR